MFAEIVKLDSAALPAGPSTLPAGWRRVTDCAIDDTSYRRRAVYKGVRTSSDAARAALKAFYGDDILDLSVGNSETSGVGTITADYSAAIGTTGHNEDNEPVSPDTYQLEPVTIPTALSAHPAFAAIEGAVLAIEDALIHGSKAGVVAAAGADAAAQKYAALRLAGVTQWESTGYSWRVTRHYSTRAQMDAVAAAAAAVVNANRVYAWANVEGHDEIEEPKYTYVDAAGQVSAANSFEWRLSGPRVSRTADALEITYTYVGAWKWAAALYPGGTWTPALPS